MNEIEELKAELQQFKDMAKKGLDEFKDVGGCWGCGLQLQLNQDMEDIKRLKAENERLKRENEIITGMHNSSSNRFNKLYNILQKIKAVAEKTIDIYYPDYYDEGFKEDIVTEFAKQILNLIIKAEEK